MNKFREELLAKTAGLASRAEREANAVPDKAPRRPRTGVGMALAWAAARCRLLELKAAGTPAQVPVGSIAPNPWRPRRVCNEAEVSELVRSLVEAGSLPAVTVRRADASTFQLVSDELLLRAHKILGQESIDVVVIEYSDEDMEMLAMAGKYFEPTWEI